MKQQPPQIGHEPLADIVKEAKPLLVVLDPLRYGHTCDENDSTEMMAVMSWLRSYANQGPSLPLLSVVAPRRAGQKAKLKPAAGWLYQPVPT